MIKTIAAIGAGVIVVGGGGVALDGITDASIDIIYGKIYASVGSWEQKNLYDKHEKSIKIVIKTCIIAKYDISRTLCMARFESGFNHKAFLKEDLYFVNNIKPNLDKNYKEFKEALLELYKNGKYGSYTMFQILPESLIKHADYPKSLKGLYDIEKSVHAFNGLCDYIEGFDHVDGLPDVLSMLARWMNYDKLMQSEQTIGKKNVQDKLEYYTKISASLG